MVIQIRSRNTSFADLGNAILIALGLREPPKRPEVEFVPARALSPELSAWMEETTGTCYEATLSSRALDGELKLVRSDGGLEQLVFEGDTFRLCDEKRRCGTITPPEALAEELWERDFTSWKPLTVEIVGDDATPHASRKDVEANYLTLAPRLRATTNTVVITSGFQPWSMAVSGVSHFLALSCNDEFFREAARALTAGYLAAGIPVLEQWRKIGSTTADPKEEIAEIVSQAYTMPEGLKAAMKTNPTLQAEVDWLATNSYLWRAQHRYLKGEEEGVRVIAPGCVQR